MVCFEFRSPQRTVANALFHNSAIIPKFFLQPEITGISFPKSVMLTNDQLPGWGDKGFLVFHLLPMKIRPGFIYSNSTTQTNDWVVWSTKYISIYAMPRT